MGRFSGIFGKKNLQKKKNSPETVKKSGGNFASREIYAAVVLGPIGFLTYYDACRVISGAVFNEPREEYVGFLVLHKELGRIPDKLDKSVLDSIQAVMRKEGITRKIGSGELRYWKYTDGKTGKIFGVIAIFRPETGSAVVERDVVLRCSLCGQTPESGRVVELSKFPKCHLVLCPTCDRSDVDLLRLAANGVVTCPCGYRFFSGASSWYIGDSKSVTCPNCGEMLHGNGAYVRDIFGYDSILSAQ